MVLTLCANSSLIREIWCRDHAKVALSAVASPANDSTTDETDWVSVRIELVLFLLKRQGNESYLTAYMNLDWVTPERVYSILYSGLDLNEMSPRNHVQTYIERALLNYVNVHALLLSAVCPTVYSSFQSVCLMLIHSVHVCFAETTCLHV